LSARGWECKHRSCLPDIPKTRCHETHPESSSRAIDTTNIHSNSTSQYIVRGRGPNLGTTSPRFVLELAQLWFCPAGLHPTSMRALRDSSLRSGGVQRRPNDAQLPSLKRARDSRRGPKIRVAHNQSTQQVWRNTTRIELPGWKHN
jgi:hypothetical protein